MKARENMGMIDGMRRAVAGLIAPELRSATIDLTKWRGVFMPATASNVEVNEKTAFGVAAVMACVRLISQDVASLPLGVFRHDEKAGRDVPERGSPEYRTLAKRPNRWQTAFEFRQMMTAHALLTGDGLALINRVKKRADELIPVVPGCWSVEQKNSREMVYRITLKDGSQVERPGRDVLHIRALSWDGVTGLNIVRAARESIGLALAMEDTQARQIGNGGRPQGILTTSAGLKEDQVKQIVEGWRSATSGKNQYKTPLLDGGIEFKPVSMNSVDQQLIETRKHQIAEICAAFGVSPAVLGIDDKTQAFASVEAMMRWHLAHTLRPWLDIWEQAIDRDVLDADGPLFAKFDTREMTKASTKERAESYKTLVSLGIMTRNEARELEGLPPIEGGDEPMMPMNMTEGEGDAAAAN